jgi:hypothetical protein
MTIKAARSTPYGKGEQLEEINEELQSVNLPKISQKKLDKLEKKLEEIDQWMEAEAKEDLLLWANETLSFEEENQEKDLPRPTDVPYDVIQTYVSDELCWYDRSSVGCLFERSNYGNDYEGKKANLQKVLDLIDAHPSKAVGFEGENPETTKDLQEAFDCWISDFTEVDEEEEV